MLSKTKQAIILCTIFLLWCALFIIQHVASFDFFNTNAPYLYVITIVSALLQLFIVYHLLRRNSISLIIVYYSIYTIAVFIGVSQLFDSLSCNDFPRGLQICSVLADTIGVIIAGRHLIRKTD